MSYIIRFTSGAHRDIYAALDWYEDEAPRQASRLLDRIDEAVEIIRDNPLAFPMVHGKAAMLGSRF